MRKLPLGIVLAFILSAPLACANTVFTDYTFNLANYSISTFQTGGATINVTQTLTGGDPGSALEVVTTLPAPVGESYSGTSYFLNKTFLYNPSSQGSIKSIGVSVDQLLEFTGATPPVAVAFTPVIFQDGNYYVFHIGVAFAPGVYQTIADTGLQASDFDLVTNMINETVDPSMHPDFMSGLMELGFSSGLSSAFEDVTITKTAYYDNLSYNLVSATPEPRAAFLILVGVGMVLLFAKRRASLS
jgi:hypothetical protein